MSSINYLREKFSKLQTEEERNAFCYKILNVEYLSKSEEQKDMLPESFGKRLQENLRAALDAEGRVDLYDSFVEFWTKAIRGDYQEKLKRQK
jgi:hypothetical protein